MNVKGLSEEVKQSFLDYDWHGNVRELEHIIEAAMNIMMDDEEIHWVFSPSLSIPKQIACKRKKHSFSLPLILFLKEQPDTTSSLKDQMEYFEKSYIKHVWKNHDYNISRTADVLGLSRQSLQYRLKKLKIKQD